MGWAIGSFPLFTRIDRDAALDHPRRQAVVDHIEQNPGVRFHELKRSLRIGHGALVHHLKALRQQGLVVFDRNGRQLRFRLPGAPPVTVASPEEALVSAELERAPGQTLADLARSLGWTRRKTGYWVARLTRGGRLERTPAPARRFVLIAPGGR